jgi:hypothetical protein
MTLLFEVHSALTWALVGLIWLIQIVHYPLLNAVGEEAFRAYHLRHTTQITWLVGPLMLGELGSAAALILQGGSDFWLRVSMPPLLFTWACTWRVQVPLHEKLSRGFDAQVHRRLVRTNWWRTAAWTLRGLCLLLTAR